MARNSFYESFPNLEACLAHGVELGHEELALPLGDAAAADGWPAQVDLAIAGLFAAAAAEPLLAEMHLLHSHAVTGTDPERDLEATTATLAGIFAGGREDAAARGGPAPEPGPLTENLLARTVLVATVAGLRQDAGASLCERHTEMALLVLAAFYGVELAGEALAGLANEDALAA